MKPIKTNIVTKENLLLRSPIYINLCPLSHVSLPCLPSSVPCLPSSVHCLMSSVPCLPSSVPCLPSSASCHPSSVPCSGPLYPVYRPPVSITCSLSSNPFPLFPPSPVNLALLLCSCPLFLRLLSSVLYLLSPVLLSLLRIFFFPVLRIHDILV